VGAQKNSQVSLAPPGGLFTFDGRESWTIAAKTGDAVHEGSVENMDSLAVKFHLRRHFLPY